jgi:predicted RNA-binding protein with PUA-like domain
MTYWLFKSEPDVFSWADMAAKGKPEEWHSVRGYAARNNMRAMKLGDEGFFYHSVHGKSVMGIVTVVAEAHPDSTAELKDGKVVWDCVDVAAGRALPKPVPLEAIKAEPALAGMALLSNPRLSVQPVTEAEWTLICRMGGL